MSGLGCRNLTKRFGGGSPALEAVDLDVAPGELVTILGPSGSGKTTLLRVIAGLETATAGTIALEGRHVERESPSRRDVAMAFQTPALMPHLTTARNIALGLAGRRLSRAERDARVRELAEALELLDVLDRRPAALSGGQRQRAALARALVRRPRLLLLDEPFSSLDAPLRASARRWLRGLHRRLGLTTLLVTHDQAEALSLGDRVAVLDRGRLLQIGTPETVYRRPGNMTVAAFLGHPPMNLIRGRTDESGRFLVADDLPFPLPGPLPAGRSLVLGLRAEDLALRPPSAEGVPGTVEDVERLGPEVFVTIGVGPERVVARVSPGESRQVGDAVRLTVEGKVENLRWFDPATGQALDA